MKLISSDVITYTDPKDLKQWFSVRCLFSRDDNTRRYIALTFAEGSTKEEMADNFKGLSEKILEME